MQKKAPVQLTDEQHEAILEWLNDKSNFNWIVGNASEGKSVVSGQKLTKEEAYKKLAKDINVKFANHATPTNWNPEQAKGKYLTLLRKYTVS